MEKPSAKIFTEKNHPLLPFLDRMKTGSAFDKYLKGIPKIDYIEGVCSFWGDQDPSGVIIIKDFSKDKIENRFRELMTTFHPDKCSLENKDFCDKTVTQLNQIKESFFEEDKNLLFKKDLFELYKDEEVPFDCIKKWNLRGSSKKAIDNHRQQRLNDLKKFSTVFETDHLVKFHLNTNRMDKLEEMD